ncbi:MAG: hypothetical protein LPK02_07390 [Rhodobacterales bacterium]|nr:hypothetical protein [Rhodobacterales bacterium]
MMELDPIEDREPMKIGRKTVGEVLTYRNGVKMLMVKRTVKDIVRGGKDNKMISHAMEEDLAGWPVETLLLSRMKNRGIHLLAVEVRDDKSVYVSRLSSWLDHSAIYFKRRRNGSVQRWLSFNHFVKKPGKIKL